MHHHQNLETLMSNNLLYSNMPNPQKSEQYKEIRQGHNYTSVTLTPSSKSSETFFPV
jgi:hypothetical protein